MIAKKFPTHARQKGFTLTEIAIVLGIMGLILGAIWTAASSVYQNQRSSHAQTAVLQIAQAVRNLYAQSSTTGSGAADMTSSLITAGVIPTDLIKGSTAINPWAGGTTKVLTPNTNDSFTVEMTAVPRAACISILSTVAGVSRDQSLFGVASTTATTPVSTATNASAISTGSSQVDIVTPAIAAAACSNNSNTIQFGFSLKS
ncbi:MAG: type 4 pilus major pilin [Alphaproteobacteria bacterium]|nr:type 4 pilus major pilin [Alphaproteobacteria bacterium]